MFVITGPPRRDRRRKNGERTIDLNGGSHLNESGLADYGLPYGKAQARPIPTYSCGMIVLRGHHETLAF